MLELSVLAVPMKTFDTALAIVGTVDTVGRSFRQLCRLANRKTNVGVLTPG